MNLDKSLEIVLDNLNIFGLLDELQFELRQMDFPSDQISYDQIKHTGFIGSNILKTAPELIHLSYDELADLLNSMTFFKFLKDNKGKIIKFPFYIPFSESLITLPMQLEESPIIVNMPLVGQSNFVSHAETITVGKVDIIYVRPFPQSIFGYDYLNNLSSYRYFWVPTHIPNMFVVRNSSDISTWLVNVKHCLRKGFRVETLFNLDLQRSLPPPLRR